MLRILNCEPEGYSSAARAVLARVAQVDEQPLDRHGLIKEIRNYDGLIVRLRNQIDLEVMQASARLRYISSATTGVDHIDLEAAANRKIEVLTLRGEETFLNSIVATAEHTMALLLALIRNIPNATESVRSGHWDRDSFKGTELRGKRLGIVGLGRLGTKVASMGLAFGMQVSAFDPNKRDTAPPRINIVPKLATLMTVSDVLTIHVPLNEETSGMIGSDQLSELPFGALIVNTSRSGIVDEHAIVRGLSTGHISGYATDVVSNERDDVARRSGPLLEYLSEHWQLGNLVVTPHVGGATFESMESTELFMAHKLANAIVGKGASAR